MTWHLLIYALIDPLTGHTRYIGKSSSGKRRARAHWGNQTLKVGTTPCDHWIRKLVNLGTRPSIEILEDLGEVEKNEKNKRVANSTLNEAEISWILFLRMAGNRLLNCTLGGDGLLGRKHTSKEIEAMSAARRSRPSGMLGKRHSAETRQEMSISQLRRHGRIDELGNVIPKEEKQRVGRSGIHNGFFQKKHSVETRERMRHAAQNRSSEWAKHMSDAKKKPVRCVDDGLVFQSAHEAGLHYNISVSSIHACARGERKCGKTKGRTFVFENNKH